MFPCRPDRLERRVPLGSSVTMMTMYTCEAGQVTFALSRVRVDDITQVDAAVSQLMAVAADNLKATASTVPVRINGASPGDRVIGLQFRGSAPDGTPLHEKAVFFSNGPDIFWAALVSKLPDNDIADTFFEGLKLP